MDGILIIDKPKDYTSRDIVNIVSKKLSMKKVGHTGTLDPIATGVLVICIGKATKLVEELTCNDKEYIATAILGKETDTLDVTGNIIKEEDCIKTKDEIIKALNSFKGEYNQEVPIYSAVKVNGKKLYEYARNNEKIDLPKKNIEIKSIELIGKVNYIDNKTIFTFKCTVSKGTYIRSLIRDIAYKLNTIGIMKDLRRIRQGKFDIVNSINLDNISIEKVIKIIDIIDYPKIELDDTIRNKVLNGAKVDNIYNCDSILFTDNGNEIAIYKKDEKNNRLLKPYKMLIGGIL